MTADVHPLPSTHERVARPNGWWGMAVFVATEATLFGTIIGTYFYLRFNSAHWPPPGVPKPEVLLPLVLTVVLVSTSIPVQLAVRSARGGNASPARWLLALAIVIQAAYFGIQIHLFLADLDKFSPSQSAYGSIYFTLLGAHHTHVFVGILLELFLFLRLARGLTGYRLTGLKATAFYWHFVNVLAVVVLATQLSPRL
jgi:heme/copper-type cytochrome/quinol oxidase subunit 3